MGIESDQLVFDYLSRVGDLAHRTSMTAAERARLVGGLRGRIERARSAEGGAESKAAVRKILARLGRPEEVVSGAGGGEGADAGGTLPAQGRSPEADRYGADPYGDDEKPSLWKRSARTEDTSATPPPGPTAAWGASAPHLAGMDELGPEESDPDWWRVDPSPYGSGGVGGGFGEPVPGFVGGIEVPELLKPPSGGSSDPSRPTVPAARAPEGAPGPVAAGGEDVEETVVQRRPRLWPGRGRAGTGIVGRTAVPRAGGIVEWAAVVLLVAGAFIGSLIPLGAGWLAAWWSPRLSRTEARWAATVVPGLVAGGAVVWVWGRTAGRWGAPIAGGGDGLRDVLADAGPVVLRIAAVAAALFLTWRARRPRV